MADEKEYIAYIYHDGHLIYENLVFAQTPKQARRFALESFKGLPGVEIGEVVDGELIWRLGVAD